jgi:hypothetical protein
MLGSAIIHTQLAAPVLDSRYKFDRRKLTALVCVHDFRSAGTMKVFLKHIDRMISFQVIAIFELMTLRLT